jgi:hypothetical protein
MEPYVQRSQDPNARLYFWLGRLLHAWTATRDDDVAAILMRLEATMAGGAAPGTRFLLALVRARAADDATLPALADAFPFADLPARFSEQHAMAEMFARAGRRGPCEILYDASCRGRGDSPPPPASREATTTSSVFWRRRSVVRRMRAVTSRPRRPQRARGAAPVESRTASSRWRTCPAPTAPVSFAPAPGPSARSWVCPACSRAWAWRRSSPRGPRPEPPLRFDREGAIWSVTFEGASYRFKDSKGMQIVAYLLRNPGREFHVLHLAGWPPGMRARR